MSREMKDSGISWIGEIPSDWRIGHLKRLARIKTGSTPSRSVEEYYSEKSGLPWIKPENLNSYDSVENTAEYLTAEGRVAGTVFPQNTVFACCIASIGKIGYSNIEASCNQQINGLIYNDLINWKYGFYSNVAANNEYLARANSSVQFILNSTNQGYIQMPIPSIAEQEIISTFLDSKCAAIDQAVQKQKDIVNKLIEYKQSIITQAVSKGLNLNVEMKNSGIPWIGETPEKWEIMRIKDTSWLKGRIGWDGLKASEFIDEGPYLITGTDFCNGYVNWDTCVHITKQRFEEDTLLHIRENDLLITKDGTVGKVAIAKNCPKETSLNSGVMIIRNESRYIYNSKYMYYILLSDEFKHWFEYSQKPGSTIKHLYQHQFGEFKYTFPPLEEQQQIADFLDSKCSKINESIERSNKIIQKLEEYKKALIYNAVTGKIDCRNA